MKIFLKTAYCFHNKLNNKLNLYSHKDYNFFLFYIENDKREYPGFKLDSSLVMSIEFNKFSLGKIILSQQKPWLHFMKKYLTTHSI